MTALEMTDRLTNAVVRVRAFTLALDGAPMDDETKNALDMLAHDALKDIEGIATDFEAARNLTLT
jgi:hypothetical protein